MATQNPFKLSYARAREYASMNNARACREQLYTCLSVLLDALSRSRTVVERATCKGTIDKFKRIVDVLSSVGVNDEVRAFFNLIPQAKPSAPSTPVAEPVTPVTTPSEKSTAPKAQPIIVPPTTPRAPEAVIPPVMPRADKEWSEIVYDNSIRGVVTVHIPGGAGTGFIISDKGFLLTNHHVVSEDKYRGTFHSDITMNFSDSRRLYDLEFIDADESYDVALCRFDPASLPKFTTLPLIADYSTLRPGAAVVLIGNPVSQGIAPFTGTVSYTCNNSGDLVFSAPSNPGCSGGPVLDRNGFVVGINKSLTVSVNGVKTQGFTNATPMNQVKKLLEKWKAEHHLTF